MVPCESMCINVTSVRILIHFFLVTVDDPSQINLSSHNVHCVAGVLKKYLRELPNPVIPVEMYQPFIQAASE